MGMTSKREQVIADRTAKYSAMDKRSLARLAAITGEDTYTRFMQYSKAMLIQFMVFEFEPPLE